jgi:uncharacterized protein (UPF0218 family)
MGNIKYILPDFLRSKLKEPLDLLVDEKELLKILKSEKYIVSVGDQVTYTLIKNHIKPLLCIVDFKIKRNNCCNEIKNLIQSFGKKTVIIENPPKCISNDLWNEISNAYKNIEKKDTLRIEIEGEEDLAALPAILLAPRDVTIIYGLPNKGVVVVKANEKNKKKVKEILDKM